MATAQSAVIFDLDGTLVDSAPDVAAMLNAVFGEVGTSGFTAEEVEGFMGEGIGATVEKALRARGRETSEATVSELRRGLLKLYVGNPVVATRPYPHALEVVAELDRKGVAIGVCTNKAEAPARLVLEHTGLMAHVRALVGGDSGYGLKPAAQPLRRCASLLGVALERTTYVGDHAVDLMAGRAAGVRVVLVTYGYMKTGVTTLSADATIGSLSELLTVLCQTR